MPRLPALDYRLQDRYERLAIGHATPLRDVAAGVRGPPGSADSFTVTRAAYRSSDNPAAPPPRSRRWCATGATLITAGTLARRTACR